ncbi:MAG: MBL fold metallo-hydrolase, partial [Acidobacteriota bacterium]|nr:MBL fold metallo-hydrolase [Acidobacteriota bacterium]
MGNGFRLRLKFWGVRGSTPTPHSANLGFGGNTACFEIRLPNNEILIFDGGTGLRNLGLSLVRESGKAKLNLNIFLTHFHWDHIQGIPFFVPLYSAENEITFHSFREAEDIRETLEGQMSNPYFPINFAFLAARRNFVRMSAESAKYGAATIRTFPVNHPQGACGYRIESEGAVIVYASDLEHGDPALDSVVREYARDADLLIYDAQYTPEEYESKRGWGHSTWLEATRVARDAGARQLVLFHHDPGRTDDNLADLVERARKCFPNT